MNTNYTTEEKEQAVKAFKSSIRKCEKARTKLSEASPQRKWVDKQLNVFYIAVALIESELGEERRFSEPELQNAADTISSLITKCEPLMTKFKDGSPQKTLAVRRMKAFQMAAKLIAEELEVGYV